MTGYRPPRTPRSRLANVAAPTPTVRPNPTIAAGEQRAVLELINMNNLPIRFASTDATIAPAYVPSG